MADVTDPLERAKSTQVQFLRVEVDTALAFLRRAQTTNDPAVRERNRRNARLAYDTIYDFLAKAPELSAQEQVSGGLMRLKSELIELGEEF